MAPRRVLPAHIQIAKVLRAMDWVRRHVYYGWLRDGDRALADLVARLMSPDELLAGTSTGARPEHVIPLPDVLRPPVFGRALRSRLA